ncbi:MAG: MATE family efflux transporter [Firmicutes bacterium]|jgi:putative MATE family efflux protein|nr:MATE family efflux transporter [Bacillota bacterium]
MGILVRDKEFYRTALLIAVPVVAQQTINIGVNLADTVMLGSLGEIPISGSSLANQFFFIFNVLCLGMGGGAAVMTGQYWGADDRKSIHKTMALLFRICAAVALIFSALAFFLPTQILSIYTNDLAVVESGARYLKLLAFAFLFHGLNLTSIIVLRTVGLARLGFYTSCLSLLINVSFNWIFIFGNLGAPRLEIVGAALATVIARIVEFSVTFGYLLFVDERIMFRIRDLLTRVDTDIVQQFLHTAVPVIISDGLLVLGGNALAMIMGRMGKEMVAANTITSVTVQLSTVFNMGLASTSSVMTANAVGRGDFDQAQEQGVTFLVLSMLIGGLGCIVINLLKPYIVNFYDVSAETKIIATQLMTVVGFLVIFQTIQSVMTKGVLRGGGDTRFLMVADVLFLWVSSIPLGYLAAFVWELPPYVVYCFLRVDHIAKSIWCIFRLRSRKWIKRVRIENHVNSLAG